MKQHMSQHKSRLKARQLLLESLPAPASVTRSTSGSGMWLYVWAFCLSVSRHYDPTLRHHDMTGERTWGWPYHATCPCDQLKRQQETAKGLSERVQQHGSVSPPFRVLVWNMRRAHHRKKWQTSTSLSFFFIFFPPFGPNLKELRVSAD